jgi:hypothetical protein
VRKIKDLQLFKNRKLKKMLKIAIFHISTDGTILILRTMHKRRKMIKAMKDNNGQMM